MPDEIAVGRTLAIDLGEVRIGLALSDALGITARPLETLRRVGPRKDLARISELVKEWDATTVVVGLPLLLSGESGTRADQAQDFAERLRRRLPALDVVLWDERLSSVEAERHLIAGGVSRRKRRDLIDAVAAVLILESYLEAKHGKENGAAP